MRRSNFFTAFLLVSLLGTARLAGQAVSLGNIPAAPNFGFDPGTVTAVDRAAPANAAGNVVSATFHWSVAPCPAAVKIKFFRPSGGTYLFLADRGPFDVTATLQTVTFSPVGVAAGDLVGITRRTNCGSPVGQAPGAAAGLIAFAGDVTASVPESSGTVFANSTLSVQATGVATPPPTEILAAIVPVAVSTAGVPPSFFRTSVQLHNPFSGAISGRLVFHPAGSTGVSSDPSFFYSLAPGQTAFVPDLLPAIGQTGIGSLDVMVGTGPGAPVLRASVFNDGGAAGTHGFNEDPVPLSEALNPGDTAILLTPPDTALFRMNVGVRTLSAGAALNIVVRNAEGAVTHARTRTYAANYFEQTTVASFLGGFIPGPNDSISVSTTSGSAIVYGATADNRTNDPSLQIGKEASSITVETASGGTVK